MKPLDIACRVCDQQAGQLCKKMDAYGSPYLSQVFHAERKEDAASLGESNADPKLVDEAFEAVIDEIA